VLLGEEAPGVLGISGIQTLSKVSCGGGVAGFATRVNAEGDGVQAGVRLPALDLALGMEAGSSDLRCGSAVSHEAQKVVASLPVIHLECFVLSRPVSLTPQAQCGQEYLEIEPYN
jgi:hypothetical protein